MDSLSTFKDLVERGRAGIQSVPLLEQFAPVPEEEDYDRGWFVRYFARKVNDKNAPILEIDETQYDALESSLYYLRAELRWRIRGSLEDVETTNRETLNEVEFYMNGVSSRLPNLRQYWLG